MFAAGRSLGLHAEAPAVGLLGEPLKLMDFLNMQQCDVLCYFQRM